MQQRITAGVSRIFTFYELPFIKKIETSIFKMHEQSTLNAQSKKYFLLYDLETASTAFTSQILTAYFTLVDQNFSPIEGQELDLYISLSRLELPHPDAILVNRIDVLEHQRYGIREFEACKKISTFISHCIEKYGAYQIKFVGYNSSKFDLPFVRTTLIRNGFNPYFLGKLLYGDGLHYVRYLAWKNKDFPLIRKENEKGFYYTFSLESMSKQFGLLEGGQVHSAKEDVDLLCKLLRKLQDDYQEFIWDIVSFSDMDHISEIKVPSYTGNRYDLKVFTLLDQNKNNALFLDLENFEKGNLEQTIVYKNKSTGYLFSQTLKELTKWNPIAEKAIHEFRHVNLGDYFEISDCDIEQDIYRLSFEEIKRLSAKINLGSKFSSESQDLKHLWRRYSLRNMIRPTQTTDLNHFMEALKQYIYSRYVRGFKMNKFGKEIVLSDTYETLHTTLKQRLSAHKNQEDQKLLQSLYQFYQNSEISKTLQLIAGFSFSSSLVYILF